MIAVAVFASLFMQDANTTVSTRVREMLDRFPPPATGTPSVTLRFSRDTVWVGEQVELVTVTWFPQPLRNRLRRAPNLGLPSLTGLWSARNQQLPIFVGSRVIGGQPYLMYVSWQTMFPLRGGRIDVPPVALTYGLPTSTSYFAPEEPKTVLSAPIELVVRPVAPAISGLLGTGPTARNLRLAWRSPVTALHAGSPILVELTISGVGNLTLWPTPQVDWPREIHVYREPTDEHLGEVRGLISGEKRFRFTVVADSAGVLTLPAVTYPYFDPATLQVQPAMATALSLAILPRATDNAGRKPPAIAGGSGVPPATILVRRWTPALIALALLPILLLGWRHRRRTPLITTQINVDLDSALRAMLETPLAAGADHVVAALRIRGVPRDEAELIHHWLSGMERGRYGPSNHTEILEPPPTVLRVIARLRRGRSDSD